MEQQLTIRFIEPVSRIRAELARIAFALGYHAEVYADLAELTDHLPETGILVVHDDPPLADAPQIIHKLAARGLWLPVIALAASPQPARIVAAMKAGALDYLSLPLDEQRFGRALTQIATEAGAFFDARRRMTEARARISVLSAREREVLDLLSRGSSNKTIARELGISPRTVEIHRANMMSKLGANHSAEAVRLQIEAESGDLAA